MKSTEELARQVLEACRAAGLKLATAESCTGGMVAAALTDIAGSSDVFDRGFVTYSNEAKAETIGVDPDALARHGAVSETVARQMAAGALEASRADLAVAITGIAGPGGGGLEKPVGLVHFAVAGRGGTRARAERFGDIGRAEVREASVVVALQLLLAAANADGRV